MVFDKTFFKRAAFVVGGGIVFAWALKNIAVLGHGLALLWGFVFPFVLGLVVAFLLNIPMRAVEKHIFRGKTFRGRRALSFLITLLLVLLVIALVMLLVVPELVRTVGTLVSNVPNYMKQLETALQPLTKYWPTLQDFMQQVNLDVDSLMQEAVNFVKSSANTVLSSAFSVAASVVSGAVSFFIGIIFSGYVLLDKEHLGAQMTGLMKAYIPEKRYNQVMSLLHLVNTTFTKFVSGQCLEAVAIATMFFAVLGIGQFDYALLISVVIGFFSLIPIFGAFIGCFIGAFLILVSQGLVRCLVFIGLFLVVQQIDGNVTYPRIVGTSVGLPPIWVLVAVTIGGSLMGVVGMLIFIPIGSVLYTLLRKDVLRQLREKGSLSPVEEMVTAHPAKLHKHPFSRVLKRRQKGDGSDSESTGSSKGQAGAGASDTSDSSTNKSPENEEKNGDPK